MVTANWTIEEAIENHMRFACNSSYSLYAVDTKLYGSVNTAFENMLGNYAKCVESGEASSTIRQMQIESYQDGALILDSNGKLWYNGRQPLPDYNIAYFSCKSTQSGEVLVAVTDEGKVIWTGAYDLWEPRQAHEQEKSVMR